MQSDPGCSREVTTDAGGSTETRDSTSGWGSKAPRKRDLFDVCTSSAQEGEVSNCLGSCVFRFQGFYPGVGPRFLTEGPRPPKTARLR